MMEFKKLQYSWHYLFLVVLLFITNNYAALATLKKIFVIPIKGEINLPMQRYLQRGLNAAQETNADQIILELDTYGGTLETADTISKILLTHPQPIDAFINYKAISAGALLAIACDHIYMTSDAKIGAATVVTSTGEVAPEKYQSLMRATMRATAEAKGWSPSIAANMVGDALSKSREQQSVITFTTKGAISNHYCTQGNCTHQVATIEELLQQKEITEYILTTFHLSWVDDFLNYLVTPWVSGLLIVIMIISGFLIFQELLYVLAKSSN